MWNFVHSRRRQCLAAMLLVAVVASADRALAGGGPENVFVVVNPRSWASQTLANYFVYCRAVPASHVMMLPWDGPLDDIITIDEFRNKLLGPILTAIRERGLEKQIDYVIYSSDFPYEVDVNLDLRDVAIPKEIAPNSSLTALTYLYDDVMKKRPYYILPAINRYTVLTERSAPAPPSQAFSAQQAFPAQPSDKEQNALKYLLCTTLGVTSGRGTSVHQAINDLLRGYHADGTHPTGTIYYVLNADVRTTTRAPRYQPAIDDLAKLGVRAEIIRGVLPVNRPDVMGLMTGAAKFDWGESGSTILPGAICENFTSTGGRIREGQFSSQTSLAEFLRYGASGTSGTVHEPRAVESKFPLPSIQVHYARGCTLAESFYQSVSGPYQLLVVGDPLCRPWANIARVGLHGVKPGDKVKGSLELEPYIAEAQGSDAPAAAAEAAEPAPGDAPAPAVEPPAAENQAAPPPDAAEPAEPAKPGYEVARYELFIDGYRVAECQPGDKFTWDTTNVGDGYHEIRIVSIEAGPIATQSRSGVPIFVENHELECTLGASVEQSIRRGEPLRLEAACPGAAKIDLFAIGGMVGQLSGERGELELDTTQFGLGPVMFWAVAQHPSEPKRFVMSAPVRIVIEPPQLVPAAAPPEGTQLEPGLLLTLAGGASSSVPDTVAPGWLAARGVGPNQSYTVSGYFDAPYDDLYQVQAGYVGKLTIKIDNQIVYQGTSSQATPLAMTPVMLAAGTHHLVVEGEAGDSAQLELRFGCVGTYRVGKAMFSHAPAAP